MVLISQILFPIYRLKSFRRMSQKGGGEGEGEGEGSALMKDLDGVGAKVNDQPRLLHSLELEAL